MHDIFTFGDIHGMYDLYKAIMDYCNEQDPEATIVFLGDACDRGKDGYRIMKDLLNHSNVVYLKGNHEDMYDGLHGMNDVAFEEAEDPKSLIAEAEEMSLEVMSSYGDIESSLLEDARAEAESRDIYDEDDPEFEAILDEFYDDNIAYEIYEMSPEYTIEQYEAMLPEIGAEEIVHLYGKIV